MTTAKVLDSQGRLSLGPALANTIVLVKELPNGGIEVIPAEAIPQEEVWLYKNRKAYNAVMQGVEQAKVGQFVDGPDFDKYLEK